jgi:hypothetical protein
LRKWEWRDEKEEEMEKEGFVEVLEMKGEGLEAEEEEDVEGSWG